MKRKVIGFRQDAEGQWIADMECGHSRHIRHHPPWTPWTSSPWVTTEAGRNDFLGRELECRECAKQQDIASDG